MVSALEKIGHLEYAEVELSVLLGVDVQVRFSDASI